MRAPYLLNGVSRRKQTGAAWCAREKPRTPGSAGVGGKWRMGRRICVEKNDANSAQTEYKYGPKCLISCSNAGIEIQTNSDDEEEVTPENENDTTTEEYPLIELFPMFTVKELHSDLQGTVQENVWDRKGKEVGLIKGVEPIKVTLKPNVVFLQLPQYNMPQDVLMKIAQIIGDFVKQGVLKEVLSSPCNSPIMSLKKLCGKV
ncbi:hypothetical protein NDU88_005207 [Pleurodeles waltl]|uniref:Uncharacterized protein n=1 Tax=Pleurodeles waltl TaxID=8319 RepID=A0AAV7VKE2_PLEWA|nr:hypothetical protein NDU88_005207 [Pleurodeles waltl]